MNWANLIFSCIMIAAVLYLGISLIKEYLKSNVRDAALTREKEFNRRLWNAYANAINGYLDFADIGVTAIYCGDKCVWSANDRQEDNSNETDCN